MVTCERSATAPEGEGARDQPGSVCYLPLAVPDADLALMRAIDTLHLEYAFAGSRMLQRLLKPSVYRSGRVNVARLMKFMVI